MGVNVSVGDETVGGSGGMGRRNLLGDLKIPVRISQAQVGLRRDLVMVRELLNVSFLFLFYFILFYVWC